MNKYLLVKLAEEGSEVAQAVCKHLIHDSADTSRDLLGELADMQAMLQIAQMRMPKAKLARFHAMTNERRARELKKGKA